MKHRLIFLICASVACLGCDLAPPSAPVSMHVVLYQQGKKAREWNTVGYVGQNGWGGAYYFIDKATGERVFAAGDITIETNSK